MLKLSKGMVGQVVRMAKDGVIIEGSDTTKPRLDMELARNKVFQTEVKDDVVYFTLRDGVKLLARNGTVNVYINERLIACGGITRTQYSTLFRNLAGTEHWVNW